MMKTINICTFFVFLSTSGVLAQNNFEKDVFRTSEGDLEITFIGHGTLMFQYNNLTIHADPVSRYADYSTLPKADIILITHQHGDHLNKEAIDQLGKPDIKIIVTELISKELGKGKIMHNWDKIEVKGLNITAVPAYNLAHTRNDGNPFHPKGEGNGYVIAFGDKTVYIAGDTENFPEMKDMPHVDIAFLPMNLPYTMTPEMVAEAARVLNPAILYPYHYGDTETEILLDLLKDEANIDIRIRNLK